MNTIRILFKYLIIPALLIWFGAFLNDRYAHKRVVTIPTTVIDRYNHRLHLEEPIRHSGYYEFPIILFDGKNYRRIDKYAFGKELGIKFEGE